MMSRGQICRLRGWEGRHEPRRAGARTQFHRPAVRFSPPHMRAEFRESRSRRSAASRIFRSARPPNPVPRVGGAARRRRHGRTSGPCANLETARLPCGAGAYPLCNGTVQYQLPGQPRANPPAPGTDCPVLGAMYRQIYFHHTSYVQVSGGTPTSPARQIPNLDAPYVFPRPLIRVDMHDLVLQARRVRHEYPYKDVVGRRRGRRLVTRSTTAPEEPHAEPRQRS